jgi:hypothetical protein
MVQEETSSSAKQFNKNKLSIGPVFIAVLHSDGGFRIPSMKNLATPLSEGVVP